MREEHSHEAKVLGAKNQGLTDSPREHDSMNINKIADHILKANFEKLESNESIAQTSRNLEVIHQMRVAIRRLRAAMRTFKKILPSKAKKIRKKLLKVDHVLGEKRDLDVFCAFIRPIVKSKSTSYLKMARQSDRAQKQILAMFKSKYYASLIESLEHCKSISAKQNIRKVAENRIRKALSAVLEIASSLDAKAADKTLHKLRISVKKLRYICEFFEPIFSKSSRSLEAFIEKTRKIQDVLGDHQDAIRGISMLIRYKSKFSVEEFLQIQKKYELKKMKTLNAFFKVWKGYCAAIKHLQKDENENPCKRFPGDSRKNCQTRRVADACGAFLQDEETVSKTTSRKC